MKPPVRKQWRLAVTQLPTPPPQSASSLQPAARDPTRPSSCCRPGPACTCLRPTAHRLAGSRGLGGGRVVETRRSARSPHRDGRRAATAGTAEADGTRRPGVGAAEAALATTDRGADRRRNRRCCRTGSRPGCCTYRRGTVLPASPTRCTSGCSALSVFVTGPVALVRSIGSVAIRHHRASGQSRLVVPKSGRPAPCRCRRRRDRYACRRCRYRPARRR